MSKHNYRAPASPLATHQFALHDYQLRPLAGPPPGKVKTPKQPPRLPGHFRPG